MEGLKMLNSIVIFYEGDTLDYAGTEALLGCLAKYVSDGNSTATIKVFNADDLSKELIKTCIPPTMPTEEGDMAVKVVMGILPTGLKSELEICIFLSKSLANANFNHSAKDSAFINAMSILSQDYPVSKKVASEWGFTKQIRNAIKKTYNLFISQ